MVGGAVVDSPGALRPARSPCELQGAVAIGGGKVGGRRTGVRNEREVVNGSGNSIVGGGVLPAEGEEVVSRLCNGDHLRVGLPVGGAKEGVGRYALGGVPSVCGRCQYNLQEFTVFMSHAFPVEGEDVFAGLEREEGDGIHVVSVVAGSSIGGAAVVADVDGLGAAAHTAGSRTERPTVGTVRVVVCDVPVAFFIAGLKGACVRGNVGRHRCYIYIIDGCRRLATDRGTVTPIDDEIVGSGIGDGEHVVGMHPIGRVAKVAVVEMDVGEVVGVIVCGGHETDDKIII